MKEAVREDAGRSYRVDGRAPSARRQGRIKAYLLKQWRKPKTKIKRLMALGLDRETAVKVGNSRSGIWRASGYYQLNFAMPKKFFTQRYGLIVLR